MTRTSRIGSIAACLAIALLLLLPATGAVAGDGPVAHKSGTLINFVTTGKLRAARVIQPLAMCSASCTVTGTAVLKGLGARGTLSASGGPFAANEPFGLAIRVSKSFAKVLRQFPGRFRMNQTLTATDTTTGQTESVSRTFRFKR
jgi:hypothetical protein